MVMSEMKIGEVSKPRFEFRTFGQNLEEPARIMARLSSFVPQKVRERESDEIYIVSRKNNIYNTKIRNGKLDIKIHVQTLDGLEQWNPLINVGFPIAKEVLVKEIFPALQVEIPELNGDTYTLEEFLAMIDTNSDLQKVKVQKQRYAYMVNNTICEVANVWINGEKVVSISSESVVLEDVKKTIKDCKLDKCENINYLHAIKRHLGWIYKSSANYK